jgi:hypothetical protein
MRQGEGKPSWTIPKDYLDRFKKSGATSERAERIGRIATFTNPSRKQAGYRPYSYSRIGDLVAPLDIIDLRDLVVQAEKATDSSRYF